MHELHVLKSLVPKKKQRKSVLTHLAGLDLLLASFQVGQLYMQGRCFIPCFLQLLAGQSLHANALTH